MSIFRDLFKTGQDMAAGIWNDAIEAAARECDDEATVLKRMGKWQGALRMRRQAERIRGLKR